MAIFKKKKNSQKQRTPHLKKADAYHFSFTRRSRRRRKFKVTRPKLVSDLLSKKYLNLKSRHWPSRRSAGKSQLIEENNSVRGPTTSAKSESNRGSIFNDLYHQLAKTQGLEQSWLLFVWKKSINSPRCKISDFVDFSRNLYETHSPRKKKRKNSRF